MKKLSKGIVQKDNKSRHPGGVKQTGRKIFPVVGIGASAGGLEAMDTFFRNMPKDSGMAFIVVQHLDPTKDGALVELLQRCTAMPVLQAKDRMIVEMNQVYVIPPNKDLSFIHGKLHLLPPAQARGLRLPIDYFFRSLADERQERCVGVILSGMGSDGMLGMRAIKEKGGGAFVQEPGSAKFDAMPRSSIDAGLADVVAPVEELPGRIIAFLNRNANTGGPTVSEDTSSMEKILALIRSQTGQDFSLYKKSTIYRRVERRMGLHQIDRISVYIRFLQENPQETELLFRELLIGVTGFFRDPSAWEKLKNDVIPELLANYSGGGIIRAWTPGCSTGEEAYSLAIVFKEALETIKPDANFTLQIFATDLDRDSIEKARTGIYPAGIISDVSAERLRRYFVQDENGWRISAEIRDQVVFAPQNLIMDPPFTRLDILVCRNMLIYLDQEVQKKILPLFHYSLNPKGILFLGSAETIGSFTSLFHTLDNSSRIYRKIDCVLAEPVEFPQSFIPAVLHAPKSVPAQARADINNTNIQKLVEKELFEKFTPAAVLTNDRGDILYISGRTGKYLEPACGKANWNIMAMAREGLRFDLNTLFMKSIRQQSQETKKGVMIETNGGTQLVDITVLPIVGESGKNNMILVVFLDSSDKAEGDILGTEISCLAESFQEEKLKRELLHVYEELKNTRELMQASEEELKSINEELQSTNEELQSTNEELTTSKEEMQSMNEELQTVNQELQAKLDELSRTNNDMKNLLNSTEIATLFLDELLRVRRFTAKTVSIINLLPGDVGRPITDITTHLEYPEFVQDAIEVLNTLVFSEKPITTRDGRWFMLRIMPYRTLENRIDGVVVTFTDISAAKRLESILREKEREMKSLIKNMPVPLAMLEPLVLPNGNITNYRFVYINSAYEHSMQVMAEGVNGKYIEDFWPECRTKISDAIEQVITGTASDSFEVFNSLTKKCYRCNVFRPDDNMERFCIIFEDITI